MSVYIRAQNVAAVQTIANVGVGSNQVVQPVLSGSQQPPVPQNFVVTVTGSGAVSASAQIVGSHAGVNFVNYAPAIATGPGPSPTGHPHIRTPPLTFLSPLLTA